METILRKIIYCVIIGVNVSVPSFPQQTASNIHWRFLIDENERAAKIYFRKNNVEAFRKVFRQFVLMLKDVGLIEGEIIGIDSLSDEDTTCSVLGNRESS